MEEEKKETVVEEQKAPETSPVPEVNVSEMNEEEVQLEKADAKYDAENIQVLEGLEAVRKRPGMYIGTTSSAGLHHLVWEIVDNAIDEALAGYCTEVKVTINPGDTITVIDNGRGIPVDVVKKSGLSGVETVYTVIQTVLFQRRDCVIYLICAFSCLFTEFFICAVFDIKVFGRHCSLYGFTCLIILVYLGFLI